MEPPVPENLAPEERVALWLDLMDSTEALLLAGLRREVGPDGDLKEAYRRWYAEQMEEHDRTVKRMAESFARRGVRHGR
jgi:hypothetical protein